MMRMPRCTRSGKSTIARWSVVRYGSHSQPLITMASICLSAGGDSLTCVGNAAPPRPTTPAPLHGLHDRLRLEPLPVRDHPRARRLGGVGSTAIRTAVT